MVIFQGFYCNIILPIFFKQNCSTDRFPFKFRNVSYILQVKRISKYSESNKNTVYKWSMKLLEGELVCFMSNLRLQLHCKISNAFETKPFWKQINNKHLHIKISIFSLNSRTSCAQNKNNTFPLRSRGSVCASPGEVKLLLQSIVPWRTCIFLTMSIWLFILIQQDTQGSFESYWLQ